MRDFYVYIMTNRPGGRLYTGVTNEIERRVFEHKHKLTQGFTARYNLDKLVFAEAADSAIAAIQEADKGLAQVQGGRADRGREPGLGRSAKDWFAEDPT